MLEKCVHIVSTSTSFKIYVARLAIFKDTICLILFCFTHNVRESSIGAMDSEEFRLHAKEVVDYVTGYHNNIRQRRPLPNVEPGYMKALIPETAPDDPEKWEDVFGDIERVIMPGVSSLHEKATKISCCSICSVVKHSQDSYYYCYCYSCS